MSSIAKQIGMTGTFGATRKAKPRAPVRPSFARGLTIAVPASLMLWALAAYLVF